MMRKEIFKNITLVTLIFISVLLFSKIWLGSNFDATLFARRREDVQLIAIEGIIMPKRIVITGNNKRCSIIKGSGGYSECYAAVTDFFRSADASSIKFETAADTEWRAALKSKSVLLDYGSVYSSAVLSKAVIDMPEGNIKELVIAPGSTALSKPVLYTKNADTGEILKTECGSGYGRLSDITGKYLSDDKISNLPFAFELGFDKVRTLNTELSQNTLLDSNIIIGLTAAGIPNINAVCPTSLINSEEGTADALLAALNFKTVSTRRYIEKDDVLVFVDSKATLRINKKGYIEYTAEAGGIPLGDAGTVGKNDAALALETMYSLVRSVSKTFDMSEVPVQIYSDITTGVSDTENVYMDYYVNGMPVMIENGEDTAHTISFKVRGGMIVGFKQYIYEFSDAQTESYSESMVSAINKLNEKYTGKTMYVSDMYNAYVCGEDGVHVRWYARVKGADPVKITE